MLNRRELLVILCAQQEGKISIPELAPIASLAFAGSGKGATTITNGMQYEDATQMYYEDLTAMVYES